MNYPQLQAYEWYREDAVGRALKRSTEPQLPPGEGKGPEEEQQRILLPSGAPLTRGDLFVTTKIHPRDFGPDRVAATMDTSIRTLEVGPPPLATAAAKLWCFIYVVRGV